MVVDELVVGSAVGGMPERLAEYRLLALVGHLEAIGVHVADALGVRYGLFGLVRGGVDRFFCLRVPLRVLVPGHRSLDQRVDRDRIDHRSMAEIGDRVVAQK